MNDFEIIKATFLKDITLWPEDYTKLRIFIKSRITTKVHFKGYTVRVKDESIFINVDGSVRTVSTYELETILDHVLSDKMVQN